ncbi:MAG: ATP-binding protein [Nitrospira sp.]|nr:ATP-binding protein [bacterium]MBL7047957.1 ATP-binding protein [Nitrospira sp.]
MNTSKPTDEITLEFASRLQYLQLAGNLCREVCHSIGLNSIDDEFINIIELAVSEACTNVIKHSGLKDKGKIILLFQIYKDRLVTVVKDHGKGFDISQVPIPDFDKHTVGGYGIYLIKTQMDEVEYRVIDGWNILSMTRFFIRPDNSEAVKK